jgi:hypothetical protein
MSAREEDKFRAPNVSLEPQKNTGMLATDSAQGAKIKWGTEAGPLPTPLCYGVLREARGC